MAYCILSLDGGGVRGVFAARILERLDQARPGVLERIDLFAGTSTGGLIALALAAGARPARIVALYRDMGPQIFRAGLGRRLETLFGLARARFGRGALLESMAQILVDEQGVITLGDLRRRVLIPAFDLDDGGYARRDPQRPRSWKAKFFHNFPGPDSDAAEKVVSVALRTSAAPTFFPAMGRFIDGGVAANNPAMAALAQALAPNLGAQRLEAVRLLSLGTGFSPRFIAGNNLNWGLIQWAPNLIGLLFDADADVVNFQCRQILGRAYHRVDSLFEQQIGLEDAGMIDGLIAMADALCEGPAFAATLAWVDQDLLG